MCMFMYNFKKIKQILAAIKSMFDWKRHRGYTKWETSLKGINIYYFDCENNFIHRNLCKPNMCNLGLSTLV